jgi:uncharacterized membrane protein YhiD involved in acid resistance
LTPEFWWPGGFAAADIALRLVAALVLGGVVALVYRLSRSESASSFTVTLVLLSVLIAMVTQVIGDNIARAFSLVGALSIVRFRTVVRDTQDTAYVIFAVAVGMAVGASTLWVAVAGIVIIAIAATIMKGGGEAVVLTHMLRARVAIGRDAEPLVGPTLDAFLSHRRLVGAATARQGAAIEVSYRAKLTRGRSAAELVAALNRLDGVMGAEIERVGDGTEGPGRDDD